MATRIRSAFTLIELLVVICILVVLMTLLLPYIKGMIEAGRATYCENNQHEIGHALLQYETTKGHFPGYIETLIDHPVSWPVTILPSIQANLFPFWRSRWAGGSIPDWSGPTTFPGTSISLFHCPSDSASSEAWTLSYVVNCGQPDVPSASTTSPPPDWGANGVFHNHDTTTKPRGLSATQLVYVSNASVSNKDGVQNTLMLSENVQAGEWADPYRPDNESATFGVKRASDANNVDLYAPNKPLEASLGMVWFPTNNPPVCCLINGHVEDAGADAAVPQAEFADHPK